MNIFGLNNYREIVSLAVTTRKRIDPSFTFNRLSEHIRVQKSHLSKVLNGRAEFTSDQLYQVCDYLGFTNKEEEYLFLLLEESRTAHAKRKKLLKKRIREFQLQQLDTKHFTDATAANTISHDVSDYYLDPTTQLVHIALCVPRFQKKPTDIAGELGVSKQKCIDAFERLLKMSLIRRDGDSFSVEVDKLHLPRESPVYGAWRARIRMAALAKMDNATQDQVQSISVVFSGDESLRIQFQKRFLELLKEFERLSNQAEQRHVYQMNFDLFPWTSDN